MADFAPLDKSPGDLARRRALYRAGEEAAALDRRERS